MHLAAEQAVSGILLVLPYGSHFPLEIHRIAEEVNLLELIKAYDDADAFPLGDFLGELQNLDVRVIFGIPFE